MKNTEIEKLRRMGWGYKKIASCLNMSENTVKSYCRRHPVDDDKKLCLECGKTIKQPPHKREKKFCSDKCRHKWWNSHRELVSKKALTTYTCQQCSKTFECYANTKRKYCSRACYADARRKETAV